ncbi:hypothetical protein RFI_37431, partial [Reticulomyxa filosa]
MDEDDRHVKTDENVTNAFERNSIFFSVQFQPIYLCRQNTKQIESPSKEDVEEKNERIELNEVRNALVLLAGEIEQKGYLGGTRQDFNLLQTLFEMKFGYEVFNAYNSENSKIEFCSLNDIERFISRHCHTNGYDGLIFVWCGYERFKSNGVPDNTYFKDIKNLFVSQTQYFVGKPK